MATSLKMSMKDTLRAQSNTQEVKIAIGLQPLTVSAKGFMLSIQLGPKYATNYNNV